MCLSAVLKFAQGAPAKIEARFVFVTDSITTPDYTQTALCQVGSSGVNMQMKCRQGSNVRLTFTPCCLQFFFTPTCTSLVLIQTQTSGIRFIATMNKPTFWEIL